MIDREKVKKGFERCLSGKMPFGCGECPYYGDEEYTNAWSCRLSLMRDAFDLLKEQEAMVKPTKCPCGELFDAKDSSFCPRCGCAYGELSGRYTNI